MPTRRSPTTPLHKQEEMARRLNKIFDLRMQGLGQVGIARQLGVSQAQVARDFQTLKRSVSPETAQKLAKLTPEQKSELMRKAWEKRDSKQEEIAWRMNKAFDLRMRGLSHDTIGEALGVSGSSIEQDIKRLKKAVGPQTAKRFEEITARMLSAKWRSIRSRRAMAQMSSLVRSDIARRREAAKTPEKRSEIARKRDAAMPLEKRKERGKKGASGMMPQERSGRVSKGWAKLTEAQRSKRMLRRWAKIPAEQRSEIARKTVETRRRKAEQRRLLVERAIASVADLFPKAPKEKLLEVGGNAVRGLLKSKPKASRTEITLAARNAMLAHLRRKA